MNPYPPDAHRFHHWCGFGITFPWYDAHVYARDCDPRGHIQTMRSGWEFLYNKVREVVFAPPGALAAVALKPGGGWATQGEVGDRVRVTCTKAPASRLGIIDTVHTDEWGELKGYFVKHDELVFEDSRGYNWTPDELDLL